MSGYVDVQVADTEQPIAAPAWLSSGTRPPLVKNPKLYKKVRKFYENSGVVFSGDPLDDYDILLDYLASDLNTVA